MSIVSQLEPCLITARPKEKNNNNNKENILIGVNIIIDAKIEKMLQIMIHPTAELCISQYQL
jgi:hypothetical protein